ncbi:MAG: META domain-containing protein [Tomitella sp.]|nr:META domain-containing protein [Tomitella sp.]
MTDSSTPSDDMAGAAIEGREFASTDVRGRSLVADSTIEMTFRDGKISVRAGCNTMMGPYTLAGGTLNAPQLASTMMACEQDLMDQDKWLASFLGSGPDITRDGGSLTLTGRDGVAILFTAKT